MQQQNSNKYVHNTHLREVIFVCLRLVLVDDLTKLVETIVLEALRTLALTVRTQLQQT